MGFMPANMDHVLIVESKDPLAPLARNAYRTLGYLMDLEVAFEQGVEPGLVLWLSQKRIRMPQQTSNAPCAPRTLRFGGKGYRLWASAEPAAIAGEDETALNVDILSPLAQLLALEEEKPTTKRGPKGTFLGATSPRAVSSPDGLLIDYLAETSRLLADLLEVSLPPLWGKAPYVLGVSLDVDELGSDSISTFLDYLSRWRIDQPTFMVMAAPGKDATTHDPRYDPRNPALKPLWKADAEVGLLSSYLAHDRPELLEQQRKDLEVVAGRPIRGHRSLFGRFAFPSSWAHQLRTSFAYDSSLAYWDLPGSRTGARQPTFFPDPDGFDAYLTVLPLTLLDRHLPRGIGLEGVSQQGMSPVDEILAAQSTSGGCLVLDWRLSRFNKRKTTPESLIFEHILNRALQDGALIVGLGRLLEPAQARWDRLVRDKLAWPLTRKLGALSGPSIAREVESYVHTFSATNLGASSIDAATMSLLSILPADAESIVDIGCGPGLMSNHLPPFHRVLCMDIDDRILQCVQKPKCIGNITRIPLRDKSVDFVMACDVLEHLDAADLSQVIKELTRVSRRYIYLQTPLREILETSMASCDSCGHQWHLNYHKQTFSVSRLLSLLPSPWRARVFNFTGATAYSRPPRMFFRLQELATGKLNHFAGLTCPSCGESLKGSDQPLTAPWIRANVYDDEFTNHDLFPHYSEGGVLFELHGKTLQDDDLRVRTRSGKLLPAPPMESLSATTLDLTGPHLELSDYDPFCRLPHVVPHQAVGITQADGVDYVRSDLADRPSILIAFPSLSREVETIHIEGMVSRKARIHFCGYDRTCNEVALEALNVRDGFGVVLEIPPDMRNLAPLLRISWDGAPTLTLRFVNLKCTTTSRDGHGGYALEPGREFAHFELARHGVLFRGLLPCEKVAFFSQELPAWVDRMMELDPGENGEESIPGMPKAGRHTEKEALSPAALDCITALELMVQSMQKVPTEPSSVWRAARRLAPYVQKRPLLRTLAHRLGLVSWYRRLKRKVG